MAEVDLYALRNMIREKLPSRLQDSVDIFTDPYMYTAYHAGVMEVLELISDITGVDFQKIPGYYS